MQRTTTTLALISAAALGAMTSVSTAALNPSDPSIIGLYLLNDQVGSNPYDNTIDNQIVDTAPTGVPHNHDDISAPNPTWVSTPGIGTGTGLDFERSNAEYTRFLGWMSTAQGNYVNGGSFTVMARIRPELLQDNNTYEILGIGSHHIKLSGSGVPNSASVDVSLRDQNTFWTLNSFGTTNGAGSSGAAFRVFDNQWANVFLIYNANTSLAVAADDGTTFAGQTATGAPAGFNTVGELFDNAGVPWFVGNATVSGSSYDGLIESIVIWDKALTFAEADAINFTNVPEPAAISLLGLGALALRRRK